MTTSFSTGDRGDTEDKSGTFVLERKRANESGSDTEEDDDENKSDLEVEESRAVRPEVPKKKKEIKWNKAGESKPLWGVYVQYTIGSKVGRRHIGCENLLESLKNRGQKATILESTVANEILTWT